MVLSEILSDIFFINDSNWKKYMYNKHHTMFVCNVFSLVLDYDHINILKMNYIDMFEATKI